jgi:putative peptidoglycan lipid II flippase
MNSSTRNRRILQSTGIVMGTMLLSRLLGFLREWTVAHLIGSNALTDTYYAAFTLPDFLNYLVAGGALGIIFIPVFTEYLAENREEEGWHVFSTVMTFMALVLILLITLGEIFAPHLIRVLAPGFDAEQKSRVIFLTRLMLPAQLFFYLGSVMGAVQNAKTRFLVPALATVIYNVGIISGGWLLASRFGITGFAVGLLAGAFFGFFVLQSIAVWRMGARFTPNLDVGHPGFRMFVKLAVPIMLALSFVFTDQWIIRWFGSYLAPASITWLTYAKILMQMPLAIVVHAAGVASFPFLAQLYSEGKFDELNRTLNTTLKGLVLFLVPVTALLVVLSRPLIYFVFSHTRLRAGDFEATAAALVLFSLGLCFWGVQHMVSRGFYAAKDTLTPAWVGTALTFLNLPVYWYCSQRWHYLGLAAASSFGAMSLAVVLSILLVRRTRNRHARELVVFLMKITAASALSAVVCSRITSWLELHVGWQSTWGALAILIIVTVVGLPLTALLARLCGVTEINACWQKLLPWIPKRVAIAAD